MEQKNPHFSKKKFLTILSILLISIVASSTFVVLLEPGKIVVSASSGSVAVAVTGPNELRANETGIYTADYTIPTHNETYRGWDFWTTHTVTVPDYQVDKIDFVWIANPSENICLDWNGNTALFNFAEITDQAVNISAVLFYGGLQIGGNYTVIVPASQPKTLQVNVTSDLGQNPKLSANQICQVSATSSFLNQYRNESLAVPAGEDLTYSWLLTPKADVILSINGAQQQYRANESFSLSGNQSKFSIAYVSASESEIWIYCQVKDQNNNTATYSMAIIDPVTLPDLYLNTFAGSYNFLIAQDGKGWTYAVNGTDGTIPFTSTNCSYVIDSAKNSLTTGRTSYETIVLQSDNTFSVDHITWTETSGLNYTEFRIEGKIQLKDGSNGDVFYLHGISGYIGNVKFTGSGTIDGNKAGQTSGSLALIHGYKVFNVEVSGLQLINGYSYAIYLQSNCRYWTVQNNYFTGARYTTILELGAAGGNMYNEYVGNTFVDGACKQTTGIPFIGVRGNYAVVTHNFFNNTATFAASPANPASPYQPYYAVDDEGNGTQIGYNIANNLYHVGFLMEGNFSDCSHNTATHCGEAGFAVFGGTASGSSCAYGNTLSDNVAENNGYVYVDTWWVYHVCANYRVFNASDTRLSHNMGRLSPVQELIIDNSSRTYVEHNIFKDSAVGINCAGSNFISDDFNDNNCTTPFIKDATLTQHRINGHTYIYASVSVWVNGGSETYWTDLPTNLQNACDGDISTATTYAKRTISSATTLGGICLDMGANYTVKASLLSSLYSNASYVKSTFYVSQDNSTFTVASGVTVQTGTYTSPTVLGSLEDVLPPCRYVVILCQGGAVQDGYISFIEVKLEIIAGATW